MAGFIGCRAEHPSAGDEPMASSRRAVASHADTTIGAVFFNLGPMKGVSDEILAFAPKRPISHENREEYGRRLA